MTLPRTRRAARPARKTDTVSVDQQTSPALSTAQSKLAKVAAEAEIVRRCVAGEVAAWEQIYHQFHAPLVRSIESILGPLRTNVELVDELAARVWYALVDKDGELLAKFDATRSIRLITYLRAIAKDTICRYFRSEGRRRVRELLAARENHSRQTVEAEKDSLSLSEFLDTLTRSERSFVEEILAGQTEPSDGAAGRSSTMFWKLTSKVRQKLQSFLDFTG